MAQRFLLPVVLLFSFAFALNAAEPQKMFLWEKGAPNAVGDEEKDKPRITLYQPDTPTGAAVVVCPGGGYAGLAMGHEGKDIADWFNSFGVAAIVLEYRHRGKGYGHPNPLLDVQRALRTVRFNAKDWDIDPAKIGVMGFSAGGHLASTAGTHFEAHENPADDIDKVSCRPDFMILCYPVIAFDAPFTHRGSQHNLIGKDAPPELVEHYSNEKHVSDRTPMTFIFFTDEDTAVPPENGIVFYQSLRKHKIPAEMHIFQKGGHGMGLGKGRHGNEIWPQLCEAWMRNNKIIGEK